MNVLLTGMYLSGWRLAARKLGTGLLVRYIVQTSSTTFYREYQIGTPKQVPALVALKPIPAVAPRFPYLELVVPD